MLNHQVAIFIPTCRGDGTRIPDELWQQWIQPVKISFANLFGGYTFFQAVGGFMSEKYNKFIEEDVLIIVSYCTEKQFREGGRAVRGLARKLKFALVQECVAVVFNGEMEFVS